MLARLAGRIVGDEVIIYVVHVQAGGVGGEHRRGQLPLQGQRVAPVGDRGISELNVRKWAGNSNGYWRVAGSQILGVALPSTYWDHLGLKTLTATRQRLNQTA